MELGGSERPKSRIVQLVDSIGGGLPGGHATEAKGSKRRRARASCRFGVFAVFASKRVSLWIMDNLESPEINVHWQMS